MARINGFRFLNLVFAIFITGCQTTPDFQELMQREQAKLALQKPNGVMNQVQAAAGLPSAKYVYKRRLSFSSLPDTLRLSIVVSVAPSSAAEPFQTLADSSARLQSLKELLVQYTPHIELIYQPDMSINTAGIQVTGIPVSEGSHVQ